MRRVLRVQPGMSRPANLGRARVAPFNSTLNLTAITSPYAPDETFVHPSVVYVPGGWNGYQYWMGITPYPDEPRENPCIYASNDRATWVVPAGLTNPIVPNTGGYNSDPDLVLWNNTLHLFHRRNGATEQIRLLTSTDGVTWTSPVVVVDQALTAGGVISPGVVRAPDGTWWMYYVTDNGAGSTTIGYRTATSPSGPWSAAQLAGYTNPTYGSTGIHGPWHVSAFDFNGLTYLLINENAQVGRNLRFAVSSDRVNFTPAPSPFMVTPPSGWDSGSLYRACAVVRPAGDLVWVWYSAHVGGSFRLGYTEVPVAGNLPTL